MFYPLTEAIVNKSAFGEVRKVINGVPLIIFDHTFDRVEQRVIRLHKYNTVFDYNLKALLKKCYKTLALIDSYLRNTGYAVIRCIYKLNVDSNVHNIELGFLFSYQPLKLKGSDPINPKWSKLMDDYSLNIGDKIYALETVAIFYSYGDNYRTFANDTTYHKENIILKEVTLSPYDSKKLYQYVKTELNKK